MFQITDLSYLVYLSKRECGSRRIIANKIDLITILKKNLEKSPLLESVGTLFRISVECIISIV